jgi:membrane-associated protein
MIPGFDISTFAVTAGPWAAIFIVALIIFAESGLLIGFFLPGDSILFTVGFLIQGGIHLHFNIIIAIIIFSIAAILGDSVGYAFGNKLGPRLFSRPNSLLFRQENIKRAEAFFNTYGGKTVILARFIPIVRTFTPIIAGVGNMTYKKFLSFNLIGGIVWAAGVTTIGYLLGSVLTKMGVKIDDVLLPIVAIILVVSVAPALYHVFKDKKQRTLFLSSVKTQFKILFKQK